VPGVEASTMKVVSIHRIEGRPRPVERAVPVLYLDLDGTVRHGKDELGYFGKGPEDVHVFPEAVKRMRQWKKDGGRIIGVSNQGGIALGYITAEQVKAAMIETQEQTGSLFDRLMWCSHHPEAEDPEYARCWCRKPAPGMLIEGALDLARQHGEFYPPHMGLMVGDRIEDKICAERASIDFVHAAEWRSHA
jgi:D-glycero-D-manno-heptose 1,7-bisphosphate phosphatase